MSYMESGYSMIVPLTDNRRKNAWVFLKPLTWDLWITTFFSFGCIGFTIWVLEHRVNEDFRGPASHQAGMISWFSLSTMVFAHKLHSKLDLDAHSSTTASIRYRHKSTY